MSVKELENIYENGFTLDFDDDSKIVFISDVHRGDGTYSDSFLPNRNIYITALKYYLKNDYKLEMEINYGKIKILMRFLFSMMISLKY